MNRSAYRISNRPRLTALVLVTGAVLGLVAACSSDDNVAPSGPPVVTTGGGGATGDAGDNAGGDAPTAGRSGGNNGGAGGGAPPVSEGGEGGVDGEAGSGPIPENCPTTDLEFLNAPSPAGVQKSSFNNTARLGPHDALPALP